MKLKKIPLPLKYGIAVLVLFLFILALSQFDTWNLLNSIRQITLWSFTALLGIQIASQLLVNLLWYKIAGFTGISISFGKMFYINCQGAIIDSITPGVKFGGELTRAVQISRMGNCPGEQAATIVAMQKLFSLSAFFLINLFAAGVIIVNLSQSVLFFGMQFVVYAILILFLLLFASLFFAPNKIKTFLQSRKERTESRSGAGKKIKSFLFNLLDTVISVKKNTKTCVMSFLLSLLIWIIYPLKIYLLAVQFFPGVSLIYIGAITFFSYMAAMIPLFPGGLGGFESVMTALLLLIGFIQSDALVITLVFRFITFWFVMLLGIVFIGLYKVKSRISLNATAVKKEINL